jgi:phospholipid/cholesterol/gamma-HCH transport system substrate-binding protein
MSRLKRDTLLGAVLLSTAGLTAWMALQVGALSGVGPHHTLSASFVNASGLKLGGSVSVSGVEVGRITDIQLVNNRALISMAVSNDVQVYTDAEAIVRARSVLGEKYLELRVGQESAGVISDGGTIETTSGQLEIDELVTQLGSIISLVDSDKIGGLFQSLSDSVAEDPEQIVRILTSTEELIGDAATLIDNIGGVVAGAGELLVDVDRVVTTTDHTVSNAEELISTLQAAAANLPEAGDAIGDAIPRIIAEIEASIAQLDTTMGMFGESADELEAILGNLSEIDMLAIQRLFIETGIRVHVFPTDIPE